jgi:flagellar basal-body rod protein FlgB
MKLFDSTLTTLSNSLDARLLRQNVLAGNLANANTPGFMPKDVNFKAAMEAAQAPVEAPVADPASEGHLSLTQGSPTAPAPFGVLVQAKGARPGLDGNGVDLDRTMVSMAQNGLQYGATARAAGKKLAILRYVASDGAA